LTLQLQDNLPVARCKKQMISASEFPMETTANFSSVLLGTE